MKNRANTTTAERTTTGRTPPKPISHGTINGYVNKGCKCGECRRVWAEYIAKRRRTERQRARSMNT